jgi:hypothetical protein
MGTKVQPFRAWPHLSFQQAESSMKQHIGSIYLILGLMAVSTLTIGAGNPTLEKGEHAVRAQALLPSPTAFHFEASNGKATRRLMVRSSELQADVQASVEKALVIAKAPKAG